MTKKSFGHLAAAGVSGTEKQDARFHSGLPFYSRNFVDENFRWNGKIFSLEKKSHIHQANHHGHFHERTNHRGECSTRIDAEDRYRYSNGELEIVRRCSES